MELWNVSPTWTGWQAALPVTAGMESTDAPPKQQNALARWSQVPQYLDDEIENLKEGIKLGYTAPKGNVKSVIGQVEAMLAAPVGRRRRSCRWQSPMLRLVQEAARRSRAHEDSAGDRRDIATSWKSTYLPAAREEIGVKANPNGLACYAAAVKYHATVDMKPQQIHDLGLAQMEKIRAEMKEIGKRSFGLDDPAGDPEAREDGSEVPLQEPRGADQDRRSPRSRAPRPSCRSGSAICRGAPVIVEPYPAFLEKTAPGGQAVPPTADGKPGKYLLNAYKATEQSRAGLESTAFHETYPGHHLQGAIALEQETSASDPAVFLSLGIRRGLGALRRAARR